MKKEPISEVKIQENGVLLVSFDSGNSVTLDMKPRFGSYRFGVLSNPEIFASADTDGSFVRWYKNGMAVAELGFGEIMIMVLGETY
ncbi:MAG TPA: hypothetical protein PL100_00405 [Bacillota bacterium]|jgi:hypothetical protein|nr:hypothetical protein [Clostridiaceae bacterium]HPY64047.1 hypothetical protein [Bacillota bacterium]HQC47978.1 hypothetical protein [Bacillota bacterium]